MFRLPVSGRVIEFRVRAGWDDLLLLEQRDETEAAIQLVSRLGVDEEGRPIDAASLTVTDVEAALLEVRRTVFGDSVRTDARCLAAECGARVDVSFEISDYLAFHRARHPRGVEPDSEAGWFRLPDSDASFRLPTAGDLRSLRSNADAATGLAGLCIRPEGLATRKLARIEHAIAAMAPSLSDSVRGSCPECGHTLEMYFDVFRFVIAELRGQAMYLFADVHVLASQYHWTEAAILDMPVNRRMQYAVRA
jgi:hypothetical protein